MSVTKEARRGRSVGFTDPLETETGGRLSQVFFCVRLKGGSGGTNVEKMCSRPSWFLAGMACGPAGAPCLSWNLG